MFIYLTDCILTYIVFTDELTNVMLESTDYKIFNVKLPGTGLKFALFCQKRGKQMSFVRFNCKVTH